MILLLPSCAVDPGDACADYCDKYQECYASKPHDSSNSCLYWCDDDRQRDDFVACMEEAWPASDIEEYGPDTPSFSTLYYSCSLDALSSEGG
jgi:hypothetical protein